MIHELVYANITIVMETDRKKITEENLIRCGREEFLEKGYAGANLRDICKRAGVTTDSGIHEVTRILGIDQRRL